MLIGWGTPFNYRSAIGRFSRAVTEELRARGQNPVILRLETGNELALDPLETDIPVVSANSADIDAFDELIVNFGNHAPYHSQCVSMIAKRAPLAIFHDAEMRDFEWGLRARHGLGLPRLWGVEQDVVHASSSELITQEASSVLATLAAMCSGAIVHGPHYFNTVARSCLGNVGVIPLCYPDPGIAREPPPPAEGSTVVIFGVINEQKQPRRVMRALAALKDRLGPIELHLAGEIEDRYRAQLLREANELGIAVPVMHGYLSEEDLQSLIENARAVCALRYPVTEGGSASLATALYRQRPLIIADVASYAMVPDDLVFKVSYGEEAADVAEALLKIFEAPAAADARARKARTWAEERFSAHSYVDALLPIIERQRDDSILAQLARDLVPAITTPDNRVMTGVVPEFAATLDWMHFSQKGISTGA